MSIDKNYYVISGFDLTKYKTKKYYEWRWTKEAEEFFNYHSEGNIQLFDDPMGEEYLYFGYVFAAGDQFYCPPRKFDIVDAENQILNVIQKIDLLQSYGVISEDLNLLAITYQFIAFEECS